MKLHVLRYEMLFEKTIRKKRISPYYLELIGYLIEMWVLFVLILMPLWDFYYLSHLDPNKTPSILLILTPFLIYFPFAPLFFLAFSSTAVKQCIFSREKNVVVMNAKNHIIVDYLVESLMITTRPCYTFLYLFFSEPYIYTIGFLTLPEGQNIFRSKELKFYSPPSCMYRFRKDYHRYKEEFMSSGYKDIRYRPSYNTDNIKYAKKYGKKDYHVYYMYLTYEKAQVFNRLFELVKPPKFRIVYNAKGNILMELQPIPGREYPPEALECMEKINTMYP